MEGGFISVAGFEQIPHLLHYVISIYLMMAVVPRFFFQNHYQEHWETAVSNFLKMACILIVLGHALVILQLFELISVAFILIVLGTRIYRMRKRKHGLNDSRSSMEAMIYDYFDGKYKLGQVVARYAAAKSDRAKQLLKTLFISKRKRIGSYALLGAFLIAAATRLYPVLVHASLSYGDRYAALRWIKRIRANELYSDGVVPQGFHVFWATMEEFTRIDSLFVILYTGPLTQLLIMAGIYFFATRILGSRTSAIAAVIVYGFLGGLIDPQFWYRQSESGPSTFVQIFLLPTFYYVWIYLRHGNKDALWTGAAGLAAIAFIDVRHWGYLMLAISLLVIYFAFKRRRSPKASVAQLYLYGFAGAAAASAPMMLGLAMGQGIHRSFAESLGFVGSPPFLLYAGPSLAPLGASLAAAWGWRRMFRLLEGRRSYPRVEGTVLLGFAVVCFALFSTVPSPAVQVDWDASVRQYLRITKEVSPNHWMIVAKEPFASVALGRGYHMNISELVSKYDPARPSLTLLGESEPDLNVAPQVYLFYEKELREVKDPGAKAALASSYQDWRSQMALLKKWIDDYKRTQGAEPPIYYEDEHLTVYKIERRQERDEIQQEIWEKGSS